MRTLRKDAALSLALLGALLGALLLPACTPSFQSSDVVVDLRVLGIKADPPEALVDGTVDAQGNLTVTGVEDVTVTALIADPLHASPSASVLPTVCLPSDGARCGPSAIDLSSVVGPPPEVSFSLAHQIKGDQLAALQSLLVAAVKDDKLKGLFGVKVQLMLSVDTQDPAGVQTALKTLVFSPRKPDGNPNKNHNPVAAGLKVIELDNHTETGRLAPGETLFLTLGVQVGLRPLLADGSIEEYDTYDLQGKLVHLREGLSWSFYTTEGGDLDRGGADEPLAGVGDPPAGLVRFEGVRAGQGTLWAVVRDGRGGSSWTRHPWKATP
jgi:hypothetical protein